MLPPIPDDARRLVHAGATEFVSVDFAALRASPHFARLRGWAVQYGCVPGAQGHWLLDQTQTLLAASYPPEDPGAGRNRGLFLLQGSFGTETAARALTEGGEALGLPAQVGSLQRSPRGRFELIALGELAGVRLSESLLALGDRSAVEAVLAVADGQHRERFVESDLYRAHDETDPLAGHAVNVLALPSAGYQRRLTRQLGSLGASQLLGGLRPGSLRATVDLDADLQASISATYADSATAEKAAGSAKQLYFQGNLLLRLTGMPRIFDHAQAQAEGAKVRYQISLSEDDIVRLGPRVEWLLEAANEGGCAEAK